MNFAESWNRLAGNFIRALFINFLVAFLLVLLVVAPFLAMMGTLGLLGRPGSGTVFGIASGLLPCIFIALDAAIYHFLGRERALVAPLSGQVPGLNAFDA